MTFAEYVAFYGLARSEGLVLRYLGDAYRALRQTVPDSVRTDELDDIVEWLGAVVRQTDSSACSTSGSSSATRPGPSSRTSRRPSRRTSPPTSGRSRCWCATRCSVASSWPPCAARSDLAALDGSSADDWRDALDAYFAEHDSIDTGPDARGPRMLVVEKAGRLWQVQQIVGDPEGDHDWRITATVDLDASDLEGELVMNVDGLLQL